MAYLLMSRRFDDPTIPDQFFSTFTPGLIAGVRARLYRHLSFEARSRVHYLLYNVEENRSLGYLELYAGGSYDF